MRRIVLLAVSAAVIPVALAMNGCARNQSPDLTEPGLADIGAAALAGGQGNGGGGNGGGKGGGGKSKLTLTFEGDVWGDPVEMSGKNDSSQVQADGYLVWTFQAASLTNPPGDPAGVCNDFIYDVLPRPGESPRTWSGDLNLSFSKVDSMGLARMSTDTGPTSYFINLRATINSTVSIDESDPGFTLIMVTDGAITVATGKGKKMSQSHCFGLNYSLQVTK